MGEVRGRGDWTRSIITGTNLKMGSTASTEGALDVPSPIRGEIIVSLSAALRRHNWLWGRTEAQTEDVVVER